MQTWAKKLLSRYWGQYTKLGDTFLENLQGLTTLKIYQADGLRNDVMNEEAEKFRKITMKVLTMQLNSVTIMDIIAYGGAALGVILAATQYRAGHVALSGALLAQYQGSSDVQMGRGAIVIGLAAVIIGEVVFGKIFINFGLRLFAVSIGAILYYIVLQAALQLGLNTNDLKLVTALIVAVFLAIPYWKGKAFHGKAQKGGAHHA